MPLFSAFPTSFGANIETFGGDLSSIGLPKGRSELNYYSLVIQ